MLTAFNENSKYKNKYEVLLNDIPEVPYGYVTVKANSPEHSIILVLKYFGYAGVVVIDNYGKKKYSARVVSRDNTDKMNEVVYNITKLKRI